MKEQINVLSLFDGISCAQQALKEAQIKVNYYFASEIEQPSIKITQSNFPNTIQLGSVLDLSKTSLSGNPIDLLVGGSPCQDLSVAGKKAGLTGEKSKLFYEYVRLRDEVKPKYFLLENVASMKDSDKDIITEIIGVQPVYINSAWFSPQQRQRYYWTNIPIDMEALKQIEMNPSKLIIEDVLTEPINETNSRQIPFDFVSKIPSKRSFIHNIGNVYESWGQAGRLMKTTGKSYPLQAVDAYGFVTDGERYRSYSVGECEQLQGLPLGYTQAEKRKGATKTAIGNGFTVPVIKWILSQMK